MTRTEHLLIILMEEAAEVQQRASKALRFGLYETQPSHDADNAYRLCEELADFVAVMQMLDEGTKPLCKQFGGIVGDAMVEAKKAKVERFLRYSREQGTLDDKEQGE